MVQNKNNSSVFKNNATNANDSKSKELGFGSNAKGKSTRFVNKDGTFNVKEKGWVYYKICIFIIH